MPDRAAEVEAAYADLLDRAGSGPAVVGVVVFGSRAAGPFATPSSDVDCFVIVDGRPEDTHRWATNHGDPVEVWAITLDAFRGHALAGDAFAWNRPAFIRARVDVDKLDGEIGRIVDGKRRLEPDEATTVAVDGLGAAINSIFRALRNQEAGRRLEGRLDGLEAIAPLLSTAFALEGRVRPFNKWLRYELATEPLRIPELEGLGELVEGLAEDPSVDRLRAAFRMLEGAPRSTGHGAIVDGWAPDVAWLRGEA
jgi:predicted nucleotidyltransferase